MAASALGHGTSPTCGAAAARKRGTPPAFGAGASRRRARTGSAVVARWGAVGGNGSAADDLGRTAGGGARGQGGGVGYQLREVRREAGRRHQGVLQQLRCRGPLPRVRLRRIAECGASGMLAAPLRVGPVAHSCAQDRRALALQAVLLSATPVRLNRAVQRFDSADMAACAASRFRRFTHLLRPAAAASEQLAPNRRKRFGHSDGRSA